MENAIILCLAAGNVQYKRSNLVNMGEISKGYEPLEVEARWQTRWAETGCFTADPHSEREPFSIVIPPPNVTGVLHLGHVLNNTMQDVLCRRARMKGQAVLWLPGTDHAGIATQTKVEQKIRKEEKKTRRDLGREEFLERVWEWKEEHGGIIVSQLKRLGCSLDWSRERFTMDEGYVREVLRVFVDLYKEGLIYRGKRMVNWCPVSLTALSDEEVIMKPQKSKLYTMRYELVDEPGQFLEIATTRPETIMGDTAVAVHPEDKRYKKLIGKKVWRPFPREELTIIGDDYIDPEFGTGVLKVTPAHDQADFEIGQRHNLEVLDVMNPDGTLNELAGEEFAGMDRFDARQKAAEKLAELGLLIKEEEYENNVGFSERADVPIEPRLSLQWFLKYPGVEKSLRASQKKVISFYPDRWRKVYEGWLDNIRDWCISRQLWWGHQIPVWYPKGVENPGPEQLHVSVDPPVDEENWVRDEDVLDTWFSSWLWPFATMEEETRKKFYPTTVLSTGFDIIFFWVARMIMAGYRFTGEAPFHHVVIHNLIRDKKGRKFSKTLGNSPDTTELMNQFGADGVRFGLLRIAPMGQDIRYDEDQVKEGRNFANKLWNACRFRLMQGPSKADVRVSDLGKLPLAPTSMEILARLNEVIKANEKSFKTFRFHEVTNALYDFFWNEYCDWYVEAAKKDMNKPEDAPERQAVLATMDFVLSRVFRLLHPFMPHITSELWEIFGFKTNKYHFDAQPESNFLMYADWPRTFDVKKACAGSGYSVEEGRAIAGKLYESVRLARNLRAEYGIPSNQKVRFILKYTEDWAGQEADLLGSLAYAEEVSAKKRYKAEEGMPQVLTPLGQLYMPLEGLIDVEKERARLDKEIEKTANEVEKSERTLSNPKFVENAKAEVVEEHKGRLSEWKSKLKKLQTMRKALG